MGVLWLSVGLVTNVRPGGQESKYWVTVHVKHEEQIVMNVVFSNLIAEFNILHSTA